MSSLIEENFKRKGFALLDGRTVTDYVSHAVFGWREFCALPEEVKKMFFYTDDNVDGSGYEIKKTEGRTLDIKENFHFTFFEAERLFSIARRLDSESFSVAGDFITSSSALMRNIRYLVEFVSHALRQSSISLYDLPIEVKDYSTRWILRYLHYFPGDEDEIAKAHVDKSGLTFYLYGSHPGVQYLTPKMEWVDMPYDNSKVIVTPNLQLQYKTEGEIKGFCHRVVSTAETRLHGRYAIVLFIPFMRTPSYDKSAYGRQQDLPVGYNLHMPFDEFSKLFKPVDLSYNR